MSRYGTRSLVARDRPNHARRELAKRDLVGRANGTIDPWYGCFIYDEMIDYALNYTYPWSESGDAFTTSLTDRLYRTDVYGSIDPATEEMSGFDVRPFHGILKFMFQQYRYPVLQYTRCVEPRDTIRR